MTDTTPADPIEPTEQQPGDEQATDTAVDAPATETDSGEQPNGNREAAKYRRQLRETETERDALRERVTAYERAEVERLAADRMADPSDLWTGGTDLETLRGKDGAIDPAKVGKAIEGVLESHPHWQRTTRTRPAVGSLRSGASGASVDGLATGWAQAFADAKREQ
ncbi:hypothetical protein [Nocardia asiatica]|uniref:hypothetical protein n=1 Tax=Nocardia asiatica TaxID=209252 RepID=UPI0003126A45|nr:hypothetical protein [Nocardia asiatica]